MSATKTLSVCMTVERGDLTSIDLVVRGTVSPLVRARRTGHPDTWSPEEGGEAEVTEVLLDTAGKPKWTGELTDKEMEEAEELLREEAGEDDSDVDDGDDRDED